MISQIKMLSYKKSRLSLMSVLMTDWGPLLIEQQDKDELLDIGTLADLCWLLHNQPHSAWNHEIDLRPWLEPF